MNQTDEQLAELIRHGNNDAFQELMRRYIGPIYGFSKQYVKSNEDAEDITQDTFFKTWKHIKKFKAGKSFKPWIYTIARNTALDHIKKKKAAPFSDLDNPDQDTQFTDTLSDDEPSPSDIFEQAEKAGVLKNALETLHPDHRSIIVMHYHEEMTFQEIANVIDKPMNTVKSWHRRALSKLRTHLNNRTK